jgi:hypothetical protein
MRETVLPVLFGAAFLTGGIAIAVGFWIVLGTIAHSEGRDVNSHWQAATRRYKPQMVAYTVLVVAAVCLLASFEWLRRHP